MQESSYVGFADFSNQLNVSYPDYLQARQFENSIRYGISQQTKEIIASDQALARSNIAVLEQTKEGIDQGFSILSKNLDSMCNSLDNIEGGIAHLSSTFEWGFSELLLATGRLNDSLQKLIELAKTPAQTWAFEQYEIARDEFRRRLYPEALVSIDRAANGFGHNPGYQSEFRFHFLLGTIRLGSFANASAEIVDLSKAEAAFLTAARYAQADYPKEAATAMLGAGRAAFASNRIADAEKHLEAGRRLYDLVEIRYLLARACAVQGKIGAALSHLEEAVREQPLYAVKAAGEAEFRDHQTALDSLLLRLRDEARNLHQSGTKYLDEISAKLAAFRWIQKGNQHTYRLPDLARTEFGHFEAHRASIGSLGRSNTLLDYVASLDELEDTPRLVNDIFESFKRELESRLRLEQTKLRQAPVPAPKTVEWITSLGLLAIPILAITSCNESNGSPSGTFFGFVNGALTGLIVVAGAALLQWLINNSHRADHRNLQQSVSDQVRDLDASISDCSKLTRPEVDAPEMLATWLKERALQERETTDETALAEIRRVAKTNLVEAIKLHRKRFGSGLKEAKDAIDRMVPG